MPTILQQLSSELRSELGFHHKGIENVTRPGKPHRVGDKIAFTVYAKNVSPNITIKDIGGWIRPAPAVTFQPISFSGITLQPGQEKAISGKITAEVIADTNDLWFVDRVALIDASAAADLSTVRFQDFGLIIDFILPA